MYLSRGQGHTWRVSCWPAVASLKNLPVGLGGRGAVGLGGDVVSYRGVGGSGLALISTRGQN